MPVENARNIATANIIAGMMKLADVFASTTLPTSSARPSASVMPLSVHANIRIVTAGTMSLKPSGRLLA